MNFYLESNKEVLKSSKLEGASSASSAARAACETVKAVEHPTRSGDVFNAAVMSDGAYSMPEGIFSGFPLISDGMGSIEIVRDYSLSDFAKAGLKKTADELVAEKKSSQRLNLNTSWINQYCYFYLVYFLHKPAN